jgi:hypothetical protein
MRDERREDRTSLYFQTHVENAVDVCVLSYSLAYSKNFSVGHQPSNVEISN